MSVATITPEQRRWATRFLGYIGGGVKHEEGEVDFSILPSDDEEGEGDTKGYGAGLTAKSIALDERDFPAGLKDAVDLSKPAKMLSVAEWEEVATARKPSTDQVTAFLAGKDAIVNKLNDWGPQRDTLEKHERALIKLKAAIDGNAPNCDLRPDFNETVLKANFATKFGQLAPPYLTAKGEMDKIRKEAAKCLPVLDAPENNPERAKVGESLKKFDDLDKANPTPRDPEKNKEYIAKKAQLLFELQGTIFEWNNRRTSQNLPPSAEAVAMADVVQRVHQEVMNEVITKKLPLPLSEENDTNLSTEEKRKLQETWTNLVDSDADGPKEGSRVVVKKPGVGGQIKTAADGEKFRLQMLSNLARMMQSEAGRHLVGKLNSGTHQVDFKPGDSAACGPTDWSKARTKGQGAPSTVYMPLNAMDSSVALSTRDGNALFAPRFIAMGHEMVHAMHMVKGVERTNVGNVKTDVDLAHWAGVDNSKWNDMEEYQTIFKGKTSEQTLRAQYGLSAERFGHSQTVAQQSVVDAMNETITVTKKLRDLETQGKDVNDALTKRGFNPSGMIDKVRLALYEAPEDVKGPIPAGWDANKLTVDQIKGIVGPPEVEAKLGTYGWAPFGLTVDRIKEIIKNREHHERSPKGRRFRTLGGADALTKVEPFNSAGTGYVVEGPLMVLHWEHKLETLEAAETKLKELNSAGPSDAVKNAAKGTGKVGKRLDAVKKVYEDSKKEFTDMGGESAFAEIPDYNAALTRTVPTAGAHLFAKIDALKAADTDLKSLKLSSTVEAIRNAIGSGTVGEQLKRVVQVALAPKKSEGLSDVKGLTMDKVLANSWLRKRFKAYMVSDSGNFIASSLWNFYEAAESKNAPALKTWIDGGWTGFQLIGISEPIFTALKENPTSTEAINNAAKSALAAMDVNLTAFKKGLEERTIT
jgi:hypothetical protein